MDQHLSKAALRDGSAVELRLVIPPEPNWAEVMHGFLKHKGMPWQIHWQTAFQDGCDDLETRFYVLVDKGAPISNIMTCETNGIGLLGHVFTAPAWRGKGAASVLMRIVCDEFAQRNGLAMYLGTVYDSMPWRLYQKFGFEGFLPHSGLMRWIRQPDLLQASLSGNRMKARPVKWSDWPLLQCLFLQPGDGCVKNMGLKRFGQSDMEGPYLALREQMLKTPSMRCSVLTNSHDMVVGLGTAMPMDAESSDYVLVDLFASRGTEAGLKDLLASLELPAAQPLLTVVDEPDGPRRGMLGAMGFAPAGRLPAALNLGASKENLLLMVRAPAG
jgi:GNAT superfamily N-acetyltransferase